MKLKVNDTISIQLVNETHAQPIFELVNNNRPHLREWLPFVDRMQTVEFAENFVKGTIQRNKEGHEFAFVIIENDQLIGRIGIYKIDNQNKIGEIGYWLAEKMQGRGIITQSCKTLIEFCLSELNLNRMEIKCSTENLKSQSIPQKLGFTKEGIIRQGELVHGKFIDLQLYSLLKTDVENLHLHKN